MSPNVSTCLFSFAFQYLLRFLYAQGQGKKELNSKKHNNETGRVSKQVSSVSYELTHAESVFVESPSTLRTEDKTDHP